MLPLHIIMVEDVEIVSSWKFFHWTISKILEIDLIVKLTHPYPWQNNNKRHQKECGYIRPNLQIEFVGENSVCHER